MSKESRNRAVRNLAKEEGDEAAKAYVRQHYGIPDTVTSWKELDDIAESRQRQESKQ